MTLPILERNQECKLCPLSAGEATSVCIPTRIADGSDAGRDVAVLVVGSKPGVEENREDRHFVGISGRYLHDVYLDYRGIRRKTTVYVSNAVRCMVPGNGDPTEAQIKRCRQYLLADIEEIKKHHSRVAILACGHGIYAATGAKMGKWLRKQGSVGPHGLPVFATYNPAILQPGYDPSKVMPIEDHLSMLADWVDYGALPTMPELPTPVRCGEWPRSTPECFSLDIETFGCLKDHLPQTQFHPRKCLEWDGTSEVVSCALSWRDYSGLHSTTYVFPDEKEQMLSLLANYPGVPILGQNILFDTLFLEDSLTPEEFETIFRSRPLWELSVANYLNCDARPERSLKDIAMVLRVLNYEQFKSLKDGDKYESRSDPELLRYNAADTAATLLCFERLREQTLRLYPGTDRFSPHSMAWFSDLLWLLFDLSKNGVAINPSELERVRHDTTVNMQRTVETAKEKFGLKLHGKGSRAHLQKLIDVSAEAAGALGDPRLVLTDKTKKISTKQDNLHLLLGMLPADHPLAEQLRMLESFRGDEKLLSSYVVPMLTGTKKRGNSSRHINGIVYPSWYPVPSRDESGADGGTKQARLAAKSPAVQTFPKEVESCIWPREPGWFHLHADYSQLELRVAAFMSADPEMLAEYAVAGGDLHTRTTRLLFGDDFESQPDAKDLRKIGKTLNFLTMYGGGAKKFQETLRKMHGMEVPLPRCKSLMERFRSKYRKLAAWQEQLLRIAKEQGFLEVPYTGHARLFLGTPSAVDESYSSEIKNVLVQAVAGNLMISAMVAIQKEFRGRGLKSLLTRNVHDALDIEGPADELDTVKEIVGTALRTPPYRAIIEERVHGGAVALPLEFEWEISLRGEHVCSAT